MVLLVSHVTSGAERGDPVISALPLGRTHFCTCWVGMIDSPSYRQGPENEGRFIRNRHDKNPRWLWAYQEPGIW